MVAVANERSEPFGLVLTGDAQAWRDALEQLVGPQLRTYPVRADRELLDVVEAGLVDAAVLDEGIRGNFEVLELLRLIRRLDAAMPVVVVTARRDRRVLEGALRLAAFSVVSRPLQLEDLIQQVWRMMERLRR
jgi:DNA-binding NtrC family response regulator